MTEYPLSYKEITELILKFKEQGTAELKPVAQVNETNSMSVNDISIKKQVLIDLKELLDGGILTQREFDLEKSKILK
ncbi:hypothetical protein [Pedobacter sp. NJ-S-72]